MPKLSTLVFLATIPVLFAGCATISDSELIAGRTASASLTKCTASGKIAIKQDNQRLSSIFYVSLDDPDYELSLTGLTGSTLFRLESRKGGATITDDKGNIYRGASADELVKKLTGLDIPCSKLPDIIRGLPDKNLVTSLTADEFKYGEYQIKYNSFTQEDTYTLPEKITITGKNLNIRISITKWVL